MGLEQAEGFHALSLQCMRQALGFGGWDSGVRCSPVKTFLVEKSLELEELNSIVSWEYYENWRWKK